MKPFLLCLCTCFVLACGYSQGIVSDFKNFGSAYIPPRTIWVWRPTGLDSTKRLAVLYMHDGQMLFDANTWNGQYWRAGEIADSLIRLKKVEPFMIVGIENAGAERHSEYCPQKPFEKIFQPTGDSILQFAMRSNGNKVFKGAVRSDAYLRFIVQELKPFIDKTFPTLTDAGHTAISGSSMGGLISLYAYCEYPQVFSKAACFSTHWPVIFSNENNPFPEAIHQYLSTHIPKSKNRRLYLDTGDKGIDSLYTPHYLKTLALLKNKDYGKNNLKHLYAKGDAHTETAWSKRLPQALLFLFGNRIGKN